MQLHQVYLLFYVVLLTAKECSSQSSACSGNGMLRLVGGTTQYEGRVEVCLSNQWGTVCDDLWGNIDAKVVCRQLNYSTNGSLPISTSPFGFGSGLIHMDDVGCSGNEGRLVDCPYSSSHNCRHYEDASVRCMPPSLPSPPSFLRITSILATSLILTWELLSDQTILEITGFNARCTTQRYPDWSRSFQGNTTRSVVVTGLEEYTLYRCCVSARSSGGSSTSTCRSATTSQAAPSSAPINFRGHAASSRTLVLEWNAPLLADRNGRITRYSVRVQQSSTRLFFVTGTRFTIPSLLPYRNYKCSVAAETIAGRGPYSEAVSVRTYSDIPSGPPSNVTIVSTATDSLVVFISELNPEDRNGVIIRYSIPVTEISTGITQSFGTSAGLIFTIYPLKPYTTYRYRVAAVTVNGTGPYTRSAIVTTDETAPSRPPDGVVVTVQDSSTLQVSWREIPTQYRHGNVRQYNIRITEINTRVMLQLSHSSSPVLVSSLRPYTNYSVEVAAFTIRLGPYSNAEVVQTAEDVPSAAPTGLLLSARNSKTLFMSWNTLQDEEWNGDSIGFQIYVTELESGQVRNLTIQNSAVTSSLVSMLHPYYNYHCGIAAYNTIGTGPFAYASLKLPPDDTQSVAVAQYVGASLGSIIIIIAIFTSIIIFKIARKNSCILKNKNKQDENVSDTTHKLPTHFVLHNTTFINEKNIHIFVEGKDSGKISESSSLVLELPERRYLDDDNFVEELYPRPITLPMLKSDDTADVPDKRIPPQIIIKDTSFISDKNFALFVETNYNNPTPENLSLSDDVIPELPKRGYLEDENFTEELKSYKRKLHELKCTMGKQQAPIGQKTMEVSSVDDYMLLSDSTQKLPSASRKRKINNLSEGTYMYLSDAAKMQSSAGEYMVLQQVSRRMQSSDLGTGHAQSKGGYSDLIIGKQLELTDQQATDGGGATGNYMSLQK